MSLSIKESCRYQNFIDSTISSLSYYIRNTDNAFKVKENHIKSKSNPDIQDEELDVTTERQYECSVVDIAFLINQLVEEKLKLSNAIDTAKRETIIDFQVNNNTLTIDSSVEHAKRCRELANTLKTLIDLKSSETKKSGSDYKFNVEGNQVAYKYNIDVVKTIDFNRETANDLYKKLLNKADILSTKIESAMLQENVNYTPIYDLHDSVNEIVEKYRISKVKLF